MNLAMFLHQILTQPGHALGQIIQQDLNLGSRALTGHNVVGGASVVPTPAPDIATPTMETKANPIGGPVLNHLYNAMVGTYNRNMANHQSLPVVPSNSVNWNLGPIHVPYEPQLQVQPSAGNMQISPIEGQGANPFLFGNNNYFGSGQFNPQVRR